MKPKELQTNTEMMLHVGLLLAEWTPNLTIKKLEGVTSIEKVFMADTPSLSLLKKQFGADKAQSWIEAWLMMLSDYLNITKPMNSKQIQLTAAIILEKYYSLTIADIHLVFRKAMASDYGPIYNRLDGSIILDWFRIYFEQRCEIAETLSVQHSNQFKDTRYSICALAPLTSMLIDIVGPGESRKELENTLKAKTKEVYHQYLLDKAKQITK